MAATSKSKPLTFLAACIAGDPVESDIDDFVDRWHEGHDTRSLRESLGMTREEYALWVESPRSLKLILSARKHGLALRQAEVSSKRGNGKLIRGRRAV